MSLKDELYKSFGLCKIPKNTILYHAQVPHESDDAMFFSLTFWGQKNGIQIIRKFKCGKQLWI